MVGSTSPGLPPTTHMKKMELELETLLLPLHPRDPETKHGCHSLSQRQNKFSKQTILAGSTSGLFSPCCPEFLIFLFDQQTTKLPAARKLHGRPRIDAIF